MWLSSLGSSSLLSSDSMIFCLEYNRPSPHMTIGCWSFCCDKLQWRHRYARSESLSFWKFWSLHKLMKKIVIFQIFLLVQVFSSNERVHRVVELFRHHIPCLLCFDCPCFPRKIKKILRNLLFVYVLSCAVERFRWVFDEWRRCNIETLRTTQTKHWNIKQSAKTLNKNIETFFRIKNRVERPQSNQQVFRRFLRVQLFNS